MSKGLSRPVLYRDGQLEIAGERRKVLGIQAYTFTVANAASGGVVLRLQGPSGARGRIVDALTYVTTEVTVAADVVQFGDGTDADEYGTHTVAVGAAGTKNSGVAAGDDALIDADGVVVLTTTGVSTAGAYVGTLYIEWFYPEL